MTRLASITLVALALVAERGAAQATGAPTTSPMPAAPAVRAPMVDAAADEQAIRALSMQWLAAEKGRDANAVMAMFAPDAAAIYGGRLLTGLDAIRRNEEDDFTNLPKQRPGYVPGWQTTMVQVAQGGDMAYETGTFDDSWNGGKDHMRGNYLTVWKKVDGQWKVARDVAVTEPPAAPPTLPKRP